MIKKILLFLLSTLIFFSCQSTDVETTNSVYHIPENALYDYQASELGLGIPSWVTASEADLTDLYPGNDIIFLLEESDDLDYLQTLGRPLSYPRNLLVLDPTYIPTAEDLLAYEKQISFWLSYQVPDIGILYHYLTLYVKE